MSIAWLGLETLGKKIPGKICFAIAHLPVCRGYFSSDGWSASAQTRWPRIPESGSNLRFGLSIIQNASPWCHEQLLQLAFRDFPKWKSPPSVPPRAEALLARAKASKILRSLRNEIGEELALPVAEVQCDCWSYETYRQNLGPPAEILTF